MKQALIVDESGAVGDFAAAALPQTAYELTVVSSLQEALALVTIAPYHLIMIARLHVCPGALWNMVESIQRLSSDATLVLVQAEEADSEFYAMAQELGAVVLGTPLDITAQAVFQSAILSQP